MNQKFLHIAIPSVDSPLAFGQHMDDRLSSCLKKHRDSVILDLGKISNLDSSYVGVLTRWHRNLKSVGGSLVIVGVDGDKLPVLQQAQLDALCEIHPHLDAFKEKHPDVVVKADVKKEPSGSEPEAKTKTKAKKRAASRTVVKTRKKTVAPSRKGGSAKPDPVALENEGQAPSEFPQSGFELEVSQEPETDLEAVAPEFPETPETDPEAVARSSEKPEENLETDLEAVALEATRALNKKPSQKHVPKAVGVHAASEVQTQESAPREAITEEWDEGDLDAYAVGTSVQHSGEYQCLSCGAADFFLSPYAFHPCTRENCEDPGTGWHLVFKLF